MIYYNTPNQIIRNLIVSVYYSVTCPNNFFCVFELEFFVLFSNPVYSLSYYLYVALNGPFGFNI